MSGKREKILDFCLNKAYENSIHPDLHTKILFYLHDENTLHERGKAFEVKQLGRQPNISWQASIIGTEALGFQLLKNPLCQLHQ